MSKTPTGSDIVCLMRAGMVLARVNGSIQMDAIYSAQANRHGNVIVCRGTDVRNSYTIIFTGTYAQCLSVKVARSAGWAEVQS